MAGGFFPKSIHPVNGGEKCPYVMDREAVVSVGGLTIDMIHRKDDTKKRLLVIALPDGKGGHIHEVKGENYLALLAHNASNLVQAQKMYKEKCAKEGDELNEAIRGTAETLKAAGLVMVSIIAAIKAQYNTDDATITKALAEAPKAS